MRRHGRASEDACECPKSRLYSDDLATKDVDARHKAWHDVGGSHFNRAFYFLYPSVPCQPRFEISKITPSGSLNLRSKLPWRSSPRSKKNLPPCASMRFCVSARSSTWKPK